MPIEMKPVAAGRNFYSAQPFLSQFQRAGKGLGRNPGGIPGPIRRKMKKARSRMRAQTAD